MKPADPRLPQAERSPALGRRSAQRRRALMSLALGAVCTMGAARAASPGASSHLVRPRTLRALLDQSALDGRPIVAMFSIAGCPWCEAIRREQLDALAREQDARGIRVVEFDMNDDRPFDPAPAPAAGGTQAAGIAAPAAATASAGGANLLRDAQSAAGLARALEVRIAPTLVFLGPDGELAARLVGYGSRDFFSAYLDDRIERSRAALATLRPPAKR